MSRPLCTLLLFLAAGCAGGDLTRAASDTSALGQDDEGTTGSTDPLTTGLTGVSDGAQTSTSPDGTTGSQPGPDVDTENGSSEGGAVEESSSTSGALDPTDADDESSSSTSGETPLEDEVDLSGWTLVQTNSSRSFTLPEGTLLPAGGVLVVGRNASRGQFEQYWGPLGADVVYLDAADDFPAINGDETFTLHDDSNAVVDGPTPALGGGDALQRADLSEAGTWAAVSEGDADPGTGLADPGASGVFLTEVSDASGSGNFVFEYVELQAWP